MQQTETQIQQKKERIDKKYYYNIPPGIKIGKWTVLDHNFTKTKTGHRLIHVKCDCGFKTYTYPYIFKHGKSKGCRACCAKRQFKGVGKLSSSYISSIKRGAKIRNLKYEVTLEYLWELFVKQNRKCALTGDELVMVPQLTDMTVKEKNALHTASLDRIDPTKGYIEGNVQWVHKKVNRLRMNLTLNEFHTICEKVYKKHQRLL